MAFMFLCGLLCGIIGGFDINHEEHGYDRCFALRVCFVVRMKGWKRVTDEYERSEQ